MTHTAQRETTRTAAACSNSAQRRNTQRSAQPYEEGVYDQNAQGRVSSITMVVKEGDRPKGAKTGGDDHTVSSSSLSSQPKKSSNKKHRHPHTVSKIQAHAHHARILRPDLFKVALLPLHQHHLETPNISKNPCTSTHHRLCQDHSHNSQPSRLSNSTTESDPRGTSSTFRSRTLQCGLSLGRLDAHQHLSLSATSNRLVSR